MAYKVLRVLALASHSTAFPASLPTTHSCLESITSAKGIGKVHICSCAKSVIPEAVLVFHDEVTNANIGTMDQYDDCQGTESS